MDHVFKSLLNLLQYCFCFMFCFFGHKACEILASLVVQAVKNLPTKQEIWVQSLGWEDPLEKGTATYSSILGVAWWATVHRVAKT